MAISDQIRRCVQALPSHSQTEVLDFATYLLAKTKRDEEEDGSELSLVSALRGMEDEVPLYSGADLKVVF